MSTDSPTKQFLEWCLEQLHEFYNTKSKVKITPWDPDNTVDIDEIFIQLTMLRDDRKPHGTTKEKLQDYAEMFNGYGRHPNPKRIVVYGRPGIGKSTFTRKMAVDWTRGEKEILKRFDVLLLINLRDICDSPDFRAMLETAELLSADEPVAVNNLCEYVRKNQDKVLLVLDGYDEYSGGKSSPVHQIWRGSQLRGCCVVITTRPVKKDELRGQSNVQFELNGFDSVEQVIEFASKFLSDQEDIEELVKYLWKQRVRDMAEIPLLLLMLCLVWKEKDREGLPTSRADLFTRFMQTLLDHMDSKDSDEAFQSIDEYKEELSKLGELAFYALLEGLLYFNLSKRPDGVDLKKFIDIGFFQTSKLSSSSPKEIVHFLHKSVQEFLAAQYVVEELTRKENETSTCLSKVDSLETMEKMVEVLKFVCELSSDAARAVLSQLQRIGEEEGLTKYAFTDTPSTGDLSLDQKKFISICTDCFLGCAASDTQALLPFFLKCVNYVVILNREQVSIAAREHSLKSASSFPEYVFFNPTDVFAKIMDDEEVISVMCDLNTVVVSCSGEVSSVKKYVGLVVRDVFLKKEKRQMLLCLNSIDNVSFGALPTELLAELTSAPESPPQKPVDDLSKNQDNSSALTENVLSQTGQHCLSFVERITISGRTSEGIMVVNKVLPFTTSPRNIEITGIDPASNEDELIDSMVSNVHLTVCLYDLILTEVNLTGEHANKIASSLHQAPNLHKLNLSRNPLYSSVSYLAKKLHHVPKLTELSLTTVHMGEKETEELATSLQYVRKLKVLDISDNPLGHGITELAEHLNCLPDLIELNLSSTEMGEEEVTAVARCLQGIPLLKKLVLSNNPLGHGTIELAKHLNCVSHLNELDLHDTHMGKEEVSALASVLKNVPKLNDFDLSSNPLGRGFSDLIQHLSSIPELTFLSLTEVKMTKKEAEELGAAVRGTNIRSLRTDYHVSVLFLLIFVSTR